MTKCPKCDKQPPGLVNLGTLGVVFCCQCNEWYDKKTGKRVEWCPETHEKIVIDD